MKKGKVVYPVIIRRTDDEDVPYYVRIPDFECSTQGVDLADAMYMAEDLLCCSAMDWQEEGRELPAVSDINAIYKENGDIVTLIAADLEEYRRLQDTTAVRKNVSIPAWMSYRAEKAGLSLSSVLQTALKQELHLV